MLRTATWIARPTIAAILTIAATGCGGGGGSDAPAVVATLPSTPAQGTQAVTSIVSAQTSSGYDIKIYLPPGYAQAPSPLPVIYAMDCEYRYATLLGVLQQTQVNAILVNVCAGPSARRFVDFTLPGAAPYYRFLTLELIPFIDSQYRNDHANRILSGHSLSAEFVMYALYMETPSNRYFKSIISAECSCWLDANDSFSAQLGAPLEQQMYDNSHLLPVNLFMAGDLLGNERNVAAVYQTIAARNYEGLRSTRATYNLGHTPMDGPSFGAALAFLFGS